MLKRTTRREFTALASVGMLASIASCSAIGSIGNSTPSYPTRAISLIVPAAPGAGADATARLYAQYASQKWAQQVNVTNVTGASGVTGALQVLNAAPDGYTLLLDAPSTSSVLAASMKTRRISCQVRGACSSQKVTVFPSTNSMAMKTLSSNVPTS